MQIVVVFCILALYFISGNESSFFISGHGKLFEYRLYNAITIAGFLAFDYHKDSLKYSFFCVGKLL